MGILQAHMNLFGEKKKMVVISIFLIIHDFFEVSIVTNYMGTPEVIYDGSGERTWECT